MVRAVHRLEHIGFILRSLLLTLHHREHVVAIVVPVPGGLVQLHFTEMRSPHVLVAIFLLRLTHIALHLVAQRLAIRQEQRNTGRNLVADDKELQFSPKFAMVAFLRLFQSPEVAIKLFLREPRRSIDALQHGAMLVTPPVCSRDLHELDRPYLARVLNMRPATQVKKGILRVDADFGIGQILDQLDFVGLPLLAEVFQRLLARPAITNKGILPGDDTPHALLDIRQVFRRQGARQIKVIIKPVLDGWPDGQFSIREYLQDCLRHDMRRGVPHTLNRRIIDRFVQFCYDRQPFHPTLRRKGL